MVLSPTDDSWMNWNFEMVVFEERARPEYPERRTRTGVPGPEYPERRTRRKTFRGKGENKQQT